MFLESIMAKANKFRFNKKPTSYQLVGDLIKSSDVFSDLREVLDSNYIRRKDKSYYVRYGEIQQVIAELHPDYKTRFQNSMKQNCKPEDANSLLTVQLDFTHQVMALRLSPFVYAIDKDYQSEIKPISLETPYCIFEKIPHVALYLEFEYGDIVAECMPEDENYEGLYFPGAVVCRAITPDGKKGISIGLVKVIQKTGRFDVLTTFTFSFDTNIAETLAAINESAMRNEKTRKYPEFFKKVFLRILSTLVWLCVEEPDISDFSGKVLEPSKIQSINNCADKRGKLIIPPQPVMRVIGSRLGGEIRKFKKQIEGYEELPKLSQRTVSPHIRSGHWHGYWVGSGDNKEYTIKWLNATLVNAAS